MSNLWTRRKGLWEIAEEIANGITDDETATAYNGRQSRAGDMGYAGYGTASQANGGFVSSFAAGAAPTGPFGFLTGRPGFTDDDSGYCNTASGGACRPPPANENRTGQETCDYAHSQCIANARMAANTSTEYLAWRKQCGDGVKDCSEKAAQVGRTLPGEALFFRTGVVIFRPGRPAMFVPYPSAGG